MNADPSVVALSSELDRGATGHEPGRGAIAGVQCIACSALSGVPCIRVQTPKVCSELCGRAYAIRARGVCSVGVRGVTFQRGRSGMVAFASAMSASAGVAGGIVPGQCEKVINFFPPPVSADTLCRVSFNGTASVLRSGRY